MPLRKIFIKLMRLLYISILILYQVSLCVSYFKTAYAAQQNFYKKELSSKSYKIKKKKKELEILKKRQRILYQDIVILEKKTEKLEQDIVNKKQRLYNLEKQQNKLKQKIKNVKNALEENINKLNTILNMIWKIYINTKTIASSDFKYKNLTLKRKWITEIYNHYYKQSEKIKLIQLNLKKLYNQELSIQKDIKNALVRLKYSQNELKKRKKELFSELQRVRILSLRREREIEKLISQVEDIVHHIKIMSNRDITRTQGYLPWPIKSPRKVIKTQKGIEIGTNPGEKIKAVFWGKVVYNGKLRGFGDVVVLYHGKGYYTLYAYLSRTSVKLGKMIEEGKTIGYAGFCPKLKGWGIYFEIRKGKTNINPLRWLISPPYLIQRGLKK